MDIETIQGRNFARVSSTEHANEGVSISVQIAKMGSKTTGVVIGNEKTQRKR